jgi:hypothetical protein
MSEQATSTSETNAGFSARLFDGEKSLSEQDVYVSLTYDELNAKSMMDRVKSPKAGAVVLFAGTISLYHKSATPSLTPRSKLKP